MEVEALPVESDDESVDEGFIAGEDVDHMETTFDREAAIAANESLRDALRPPTQEELSMLLYPHEVDRARQIKQAVAKRPDLKPLTDFEYVHYAMCTVGEPEEKILQRITMMQAFRQEYNIHDTTEEGIELLDRLTAEVQPGFVLTIEYLAATQNFLSVVSWSQLFPARCKTYNDYRVFLGAQYYRFQAKLCNFCAIRQGTSTMVECKGASMENCEMGFFDKMLHKFIRWYPVNPKECFFLNTPGCVNVVMGLWQKYMTPHRKDCLKLGHQISGMEGVPLDPLYQSPTPEIARQNLLARSKDFLNTRYKNEREFRLPG